MAYTVYCDGEPLDIRVEDIVLIDPVLTLEDNTPGTLEFAMAPQHPMYSRVSLMTSTVTVCQDGDELWSGRPTEESIDLWGRRHICCEGELAFLCDSVQPQAEYRDSTVETYLRSLLELHNAQVDEARQFTLGTVGFTNHMTPQVNETPAWRFTNFQSTFQEIKDRLISTLGGHLRVRKVGGVRYLDYLSTYPYQGAYSLGSDRPVIRFGENLLDYASDLSMTDLATAVVPLGANLDIDPTVAGQFVTEEISADTATVPARASVTATFEVSRPGYKYLGIVGVDTSSKSILPVDTGYDDPTVSGGTVSVVFRNFSAEEQKYRPAISCLYVRADFTARDFEDLRTAPVEVHHAQAAAVTAPANSSVTVSFNVRRDGLTYIGQTGVNCTSTAVVVVNNRWRNPDSQGRIEVVFKNLTAAPVTFAPAVSCLYSAPSLVKRGKVYVKDVYCRNEDDAIGGNITISAGGTANVSFPAGTDDLRYLGIVGLNTTDPNVVAYDSGYSTGGTVRVKFVNTSASDLTIAPILCGLYASTVDETPDGAPVPCTTIESVNSGLNYVEDTDAVQRYGRITKTVRWEDVDDPQTLLALARNYLSGLPASMVLTVKAVDMHLMDETVSAVRLLDYVQVISAPHGLNRPFPVTAMTIPLNHPAQQTITLGARVPQTLTAAAVSTSAQLRQTQSDIPSRHQILNQTESKAAQLVQGGS